MAYAMEEETTMMIPSQGMDEDIGEGIASLPEQGDSGIADLPQAAQQLAQLGRAQDTFLGHLAQDEIVIPLALLQASPELEDVIRNAFEAEGMDYSQYVVGSDENSINPETGLPEFGLGSRLKKGLKSAGKKITKGLKSAGKEIKKAGKKLEKEVVRKPIKKIARELKRAAPVVLPIALNFVPGIGPIMAAGLGSGLGTLIQGGDINDALKRAAVAAAFAGVAQGIQKGMAKPTPTGAETAATDSLAGPELYKVPTEPPLVPSVETMTPTVAPTTTTGNVLDVSANIPKPPVPVPPVDTVSMGQQIYTDPTKGVFDVASGEVTRGVAVPPPPPPTPTSITDRIAAGYNKAKDVASRAGDYMFRGGKTELEVEAAKKAAGEKYIQDRLAQNIMPTEQGLLAAEAAAGPSALARFGPSAALGVGALYASGAFKTPEEEMDPEYVAMQQQLAEDRAIAANIPQMGDPAAIDYITAQQTLAGAPNYSYLNPLYQGGYFLNNPTMNNPTLNTGITMAKGGGEMAVTNLDVSKFPRRTGRISGPGTETSDSIPAMLSDGEFVMNARAVRGAGNGSREAGVRKMYDMMRNFVRNFESKVA
jgi:hypothetical protein